MGLTGVSLDQDISGMELPVNATDLSNLMNTGRIHVGSLHNIVLLDQYALLGEYGHYLVMHETMHCWSMWHEFSHPVPSWQWDPHISDAMNARFQQPTNQDQVQYSDVPDMASMMLYNIPKQAFVDATTPFDPAIFTNEHSQMSDGDKIGVQSALQPLNGKPEPISFEKPFNDTIRTLDITKEDMTATPTTTTTTTTNPMSTPYRDLDGTVANTEVWITIASALIAGVFLIFVGRV